MRRPNATELGLFGVILVGLVVSLPALKAVLWVALFVLSGGNLNAMMGGD